MKIISLLLEKQCLHWTFLQKEAMDMFKCLSHPYRTAPGSAIDTSHCSALQGCSLEQLKTDYKKCEIQVI